MEYSADIIEIFSFLVLNPDTCINAFVWNVIHNSVEVKC